MFRLPFLGEYLMDSSSHLPTIFRLCNILPVRISLRLGLQIGVCTNAFCGVARVRKESLTVSGRAGYHNIRGSFDVTGVDGVRRHARTLRLHHSPIVPVGAVYISYAILLWCRVAVDT